MSVVYHGERFAGFRLVDLVGCTAVTTVYRAVDPEGRTVALTVLDAPVDDQDRQRFLRECAIARDLHHPSIVPIHEVGEVEGRLYVAMRYAPGGDLGALLAGGRCLDPDRAVALLTEVAAALDAAHARGLVHRDVTPANILVETTDGIEHAHLCGFGSWTGTREYRAPEQLDGGVVDARTDVHALGLVLHRCLDPHRRFSAGLDEVLARGVASRREDRYPTATAFLTAARSAIAEPGYRDPAAAALHHRPAPLRRPLPLSPLMVAALAATALAGVAGLAIGVHGASHPGTSNTGAATALAPPAENGLLAPAATATASAPSPSAAPEASPSPAPVPPAAPTPAGAVIAPVAPVVPPPVAHPQPPVLSITPPLSGGTLFYATVRNSGQTQLVAGASSLSSTATAAIVDDGCAGARLSPGASCVVTVRLEPPISGGGTTVLTVPMSDGRPVTFTIHGS